MLVPMPLAATWMELETLIPSEVKSKREGQIPCHLHVESKILAFLQTETDSQAWRTDLGLLRGKGREWDGWGVRG